MKLEDLYAPYTGKTPVIITHDDESGPWMLAMTAPNVEPVTYTVIAETGTKEDALLLCTALDRLVKDIEAVPTKRERVMVHTALDNAVANGQPPPDNKPPPEGVRAVAEDLKSLDADLENVPLANIEEHVRTWFAERT